jgi:hypothetical protein
MAAIMSSPCRRWASLVPDETRIFAAGDQEAHRSSASPTCFNARRVRARIHAQFRNGELVSRELGRCELP